MIAADGWSISPETPFEWKLVMDEEVKRGLYWGKPRPGHPEGAVGRHVQDMLAAIDAAGHADRRRARLRVAAILHDSFKWKVERVPGGKRLAPGQQNHGWHAAQALLRLLRAQLLEGEGLPEADERLAALLEFHDKPHSIWLSHGSKPGHEAKADARLREVLAKVDVDEFAHFCIVDGQTEGKESAPLEWLLDGIVRLGLSPGPFMCKVAPTPEGKLATYRTFGKLFK